MKLSRCNYEGRDVTFDTAAMPEKNKISEAHEAGQFYEIEMLENMHAQIISNKYLNGCVIDVGANIGNHTVFMGRMSRRRVYAFEPDRVLYEILKRNVYNNGLYWVACLNLALGGRHGVVCQRPEGTPGNPVYCYCKAGECPTITPVVTLDSMMPFIGKPVAILKIDVEGMECSVLQGAAGLIGKHKPAIYAEASTPEEMKDIDLLLEPFGYKRVARFNATPTYKWEYQSA